MERVTWTELIDTPVKELSKGIWRRLLWTGHNGGRALIIEIGPGACYEGIDVHEAGSEEIYVLSGVFNDGVRDYRAGTFIHNPAGSSHVPQSKTGCTLFVFLPGC